jgi:hypothetical protein
VFWGTVLFTLLVGTGRLGLSVRFYVERLKLLLVPRLAAVLTVGVLLKAASPSILSHRWGWSTACVLLGPPGEPCHAPMVAAS